MNQRKNHKEYAREEKLGLEKNQSFMFVKEDEDIEVKIIYGFNMMSIFELDEDLKE